MQKEAGTPQRGKRLGFAAVLIAGLLMATPLVVMAAFGGTIYACVKSDGSIGNGGDVVTNPALCAKGDTAVALTGSGGIGIQGNTGLKGNTGANGTNGAQGV